MCALLRVGADTELCRPGPFANLDLRRLIVERQAAPDIILSGLITNDDVGPLFDMYVPKIRYMSS